MSDGDPMSDSMMGDPVYEGVYGPFRIEAQDRREVLGYRLALTAVALGQLGLLLQLRSLGPSGLWPWLIVMAMGLGLALRWIHIYLKPLHQALQLFWLVGCLGWLALAWQAGPDAMLPAMAAGIGFLLLLAWLYGRRERARLGVLTLDLRDGAGALAGTSGVTVSTDPEARRPRRLWINAALTLALLQFRAFPIPRFLIGREWAERLHEPNGGVPYGIALAAAALIVYPETMWMQTLAG